MVLKVYISTLSGNLKVKKEQSLILSLLNAKKVDFKEVDLADASNECEKCSLFEELKKKDKPLVPPHIFLDEEYLGGYEEFYEALEMEELESFLKLPGCKPKPFPALMRSSSSEGGSESKGEEKHEETSGTEDDPVVSKGEENANVSEDENQKDQVGEKEGEVYPIDRKLEGTGNDESIPKNVDKISLGDSSDSEEDEAEKSMPVKEVENEAQNLEDSDASSEESSDKSEAKSSKKGSDSDSSNGSTSSVRKRSESSSSGGSDAKIAKGSLEREESTDSASSVRKTSDQPVEPIRKKSGTDSDSDSSSDHSEHSSEKSTEVIKEETKDSNHSSSSESKSPDSE
ncbi:hypothetical protein MN116_001427 [Schistosoma mekongi]|uniref:Glutaredoxin domain-containing protein n=1 Tax=Schistosoma mekongi TaxID=38744 RepID=A0AAE1ZM34_SCHME|nr:hypothetical protein MN116_001427 [Schistosoma mekongi]